MGLPEPDFFTEAEIVKRWTRIYGECSSALVRRYIDTKKLKAEPVYSPTSTSNGGFVNAWRDERHPAREHGRKIVGYNIALAEVLRFEAENPPENDGNLKAEQGIISSPVTVKMGSDETPEEYVARRRKEGAKDLDIAWDLYRTIKSLEKIGRIFDPNPFTEEASTYTHRGKKYLGLK